MKKISKIFEYLLNIGIAIIVIIVAILGYGTFQTKVLKEEYSNIFGYTMFEVATGSMSGTIEIGDYVIVKILDNIDIDELETDDIIVFKQNNSIITHRLINIDEEELTTKGDANNTSDTPIKKDAVIGKVIKIVENVAIWKKVFMTPDVYIPIIITITLFGTIFIIDENDKKNEVDKVSGGKNNNDK